MSAAVTALARRAYPRRKGAQLHFVRGYLAELGDQAAIERLVGSYAEGDGAAAAKREALL